MTKPLNPLDALLNFVEQKPHTSGRRELRAERYAVGFKIYAHPKNPEDAMKAAVTGQMVETLPIRRADPKVSLSKKERAKLKREQKRNGDGSAGE